MPKHGFLTPKAIANRIKAKGLQKLRWYCQMCEKQCRDENGFKCHTMSESHARQMRLFSENPDKYISDYSKVFERNFLQLCKLKGKRVKANGIYQELIANRSHIHMNSTHWVTLTTFVQYLGKTGKCRVDKAERDWYVDFIDRDPKTLKRQAAEERNSKLDKNFEDQSLATIEAQVARANEDHESSSETEEEKEFKREDGQKLGFNLKTTPNDERAVVPSVLGKRKKSSGDGKKVKKEKSDHRESAENDEHRNGERKNRWGEKPLLQPIKAVKKKQKLSDLAMLAKEIEHGKNMTGFSSNPFSSTQRSVKSEKSKSRTKKSSRRSGGHSPSEPHKKMQKTEKKAEKRWIREGIIVKLMNKKFQDGKYYKQKGTITSISEKFLAIVELKDGTVVKFDQRMLETVLPALGKPVAILLGEHKGKTGVLKRIREKDFKAEVDVTLVGRILVPYDYICKVAKNFKK